DLRGGVGDRPGPGVLDGGGGQGDGPAEVAELDGVADQEQVARPDVGVLDADGPAEGGVPAGVQEVEGGGRLGQVLARQGGGQAGQVVFPAGGHDVGQAAVGQLHRHHHVPGEADHRVDPEQV